MENSSNSDKILTVPQMRQKLEEIKANIQKLEQEGKDKEQKLNEEYERERG